MNNRIINDDVEAKFMRDKIINIIIDSLKDASIDLENKETNNSVLETHIYGPTSCLDSLALVRLLVNIESRISEEFGRDIVITDEKAMSQSRSPFRTVKSLLNYIEGLLKREM